VKTRGGSSVKKGGSEFLEKNRLAFQALCEVESSAGVSRESFRHPPPRREKSGFLTLPSPPRGEESLYPDPRPTWIQKRAKEKKDKHGLKR